MAHDARVRSVVDSLSQAHRVIEFPTVTKDGGRLQTTSEIFGQNVFSLKEMSKMLPKPVYKNFVKQLKGNETLDKVTADAIAHAVKVWAIQRNASHFTHWFQPLNDSTAEKHDSFLTLKSTFVDGFEEVRFVRTSVCLCNYALTLFFIRWRPLILSRDLNCSNLNLMLLLSPRVVCGAPLKLVGIQVRLVGSK